MQHTGRACNPCYLKYEKEKREEFYLLCRFWRDTEKAKDAKKESPPEKHPKTLLCTAVVVSFFVLLLFCSSSYVVVV